MFAADVAGVADASHLAALVDFEDGTTTTEQMAGVIELHLDIVVEIQEMVVTDGDKEVHTGSGISLCIDGLQGGKALLTAFLVEPLHIVLLDEARVGEHDAAQVLGGGGADDLPSESQFMEIGDEAAVVDVRVSEDDIVDFFRFDHDVAVHSIGLKALALEHTAIQKNFLAMVGGDEVLAARHFLGRTDEFDFHRLNSKICTKNNKKK